MDHLHEIGILALLILANVPLPPKSAKIASVPQLPDIRYSENASPILFMCLMTDKANTGLLHFSRSMVV